LFITFPLNTLQIGVIDTGKESYWSRFTTSYSWPAGSHSWPGLCTSEIQGATSPSSGRDWTCRSSFGIVFHIISSNDVLV